MELQTSAATKACKLMIFRESAGDVMADHADQQQQLPMNGGTSWDDLYAKIVGRSIVSAGQFSDLPMVSTEAMNALSVLYMSHRHGFVSKTFNNLRAVTGKLNCFCYIMSINELLLTCCSIILNPLWCLKVSRPSISRFGKAMTDFDASSIPATSFVHVYGCPLCSTLLHLRCPGES